MAMATTSGIGVQGSDIFLEERSVKDMLNSIIPGEGRVDQVAHVCIIGRHSSPARQWEFATRQVNEHVVIHVTVLQIRHVLTFKDELRVIQSALVCQLSRPGAAGLR